MKKAFSMIELIFVIVIIGILSSIAIPKFIAKTTFEAEKAKAIQKHQVGGSSNSNRSSNTSENW